MLFRTETLHGIQSGTIRLAFRRWRRPTVRAGGTLLTPVGQLSIEAVEPIDVDQISAADARLAGYDSRDALLAELASRRDGTVHRIALGTLRPDPRLALREQRVASDQELEALRAKLARLDGRSAGGPWTRQVLELLRAHPAVRAGDLCEMVGMEKAPFKLNVRKLKNLGLTESLGTGYRLSPRGEALLDRDRRADLRHAALRCNLRQRRP
jgi:hypothetical protein